MTQLRIGVVGAGIGAGYVAGFQKLPGAEVTALCARTLERIRPLADHYRVPKVYTDYAAMLAEEPLDVVVIATPNYLHHAMTLQALEAGRHVLCDKPLALNTAQAQEMYQRAEQLGRRHFVPFIFRFLPAAAYVKEIIASGFLGRLLHVNSRYYVLGWGDLYGPMRWQYNKQQAGSGTLGNIGSHLLHLIHWWLGGIRRVSASMATAILERATADGRGLARVDVDDICVFVGELDDGAPLVFNTSSVAHVARTRMEVELFGTEGSLTFQHGWGMDYELTGAIMAMRRGDNSPKRVELPVRLVDEFVALPDYYTPMRGCFARMAAELDGAIREDRPAHPNFLDGLRVQQVMEAVMRSAEARQWVEVQDV